MQAYQCDRCKKFFSEEEANSCEIYLQEHTGNTEEYVDLCKKCTDEYLKWRNDPNLTIL